MSKMYDAGITTAYGAAVRGGYEGTYEQFCTDLGKLADVLSEFLGLSVTVETLAEGAEARGEYDAGVLSLGIPRGDTGNGIQSIALNADYTLTVTYTNGQTWTSGSIRGETGATPDLQIGTVSTLSPGSPATAEITGTRDEPRLNLGIPQGVPGEVPAASIAPAYDASSTYAVGEYVMYNNALYRCTTAITTAEAWTAAHWTAAQIGEDLTDCSRQISDDVTGLDTKAPVILETASGAIATFDDGADSMPIRKLVAQIEPVQDLHGQSSPYPAGGGINLCDPAKRTGVSGSNIVRWYYNDGFELEANVSYAIAVNITSPAPTLYIYDKETGSALYQHITSGVYTPTEAKTVYFQYYASSVPTGLQFMVAKSSTVPAFAPYENLCPISGWTGANIHGTGKNLLDITNATDIVSTWDYDSGSKMYRYTLNGLSPTDLYTLSVNIGTALGASSTRRLYLVGATTVNIDCGTSAGRFSVSAYPTATGSIQVRFPRAATQETDLVATLTQMQLEKGSAPTPFAGVTYTTLPITFTDPSTGDPLTIYGGTVTLNEDGSADLVSKWAKTTVNNLSWSYYNTAIYARITNKKTDIDGQRSKVLCSDYWTGNPVAAVGNASQWSNNSIRGNYESNYVYIKDTRYTSAATFKSAQANVEIVYMLATPTTYHFPNIGQLKTFLGVNNVWCDTGDTEVTYPADTKLFIEKLTQPTEDDMTADHAISAGTFFQLGNTLYLATAAIAAGATITPGTNATKLSLADALNTLNS